MNATYLFEKPSRYMKCSESRWTAVAQMSLIYISTHIPGCKIPVYQSDANGYLLESELFCIDKFDNSNTVCGQILMGEQLQVPDFNMDFRIVPDILSINDKHRHVTLIEVKTLSESVVRNIELYNKCKKYIETIGWSCQLYYLLSHGHEKQKDWPELSKWNSKIILWEDIFRIMANTPLSDVIGDSLSNYCDRPMKRTQQGGAISK